MKPEPVSIPANEAQFLETRAFQVFVICRMFNVSPGLVGPPKRRPTPARNRT
ncbi:MAG: hypothetical protein IPM07_26390 [Anaerolineales bacterium]|nr:hypothetical protein [Anaerolineales bacterium]